MEISIQQSDKMKAVGGKHAAKTRATTSLGRSPSMKSDFGSIDFGQSFGSSIFSTGSFETDETTSPGRISTALGSVPSTSVSPLASPMRPQSIHINSKSQQSQAFSPTGSATFSSFLDGENNYNLHNNKGATVTLPEVPTSPNAKIPSSLVEVALHKKSSSRKLERSASEHANRPKTKFVSSGLGFKTSQAFSPKGSAKAMLAKIMNDFDG